jgi:hypothetical protein
MLFNILLSESLKNAGGKKLPTFARKVVGICGFYHPTKNNVAPKSYVRVWGKEGVFRKYFSD